MSELPNPRAGVVNIPAIQSSRQPAQAPTPRAIDPRMRRQALIAEYKIAPRPLPRPLIKEDVAPPLCAVAQLLRFRVRGVLGQPHHQFLVVAPVAARELRGGEFLHQVPRLRVEDPEEGFVAE